MSKALSEAIDYLYHNPERTQKDPALMAAFNQFCTLPKWTPSPIIDRFIQEVSRHRREER